MDLIKNLQKFGLTEKQSRFYLASLKLGSASITELVRASGLKRATAYLVVEELINKGLMRRIKIGNKIYYEAQKPIVIKKDLQEKSASLDKIMPELSIIIQEQSGRPEVLVLEGHAGIKQIYREARQHKELIFWSDIEQVAKILGEELQEELDYQQEHNIKVRDIVSDTTFGRRYARQQNKKAPQHQTKVLKKKVFTSDNMIYGDNLVIFSVKQGNLFAVKITSKEISQTYRVIFESLWQTLK